jgi:hypothetical protein
MSHPARALMAALAVFVVWMMIRACRSGTIFSEGTAFSAEEQPALFALGLAAHGFIVALLLWLRPPLGPVEQAALLRIPCRHAILTA